MRKSIKFAAVLSSLLLLSACAPATESTPTKGHSTVTPEPKAKATVPPIKVPTQPEKTASAPTEEPTLEGIIVGANSITLLDQNDAVMDTIPYTETPQNFIDTLEPLLGEYTTSYSGDEICWYQMTSVSWGDFQFAFSKQDLNTDSGIMVVLNEENLPQDLNVSTPNGAYIGGDISKLYEQAPEEQKTQYTWEETGEMFTEVVDEVKEIHEGYREYLDENDNVVGEATYSYEGVVVYGHDKEIKSIRSPWILDYQC